MIADYILFFIHGWDQQVPGGDVRGLRPQGAGKFAFTAGLTLRLR